MTTDYRALCAKLAESVRYLLDCVADGESDPVAIAECVQHLGATRTALSQPEPEGPTLEEINELFWKHSSEIGDIGVGLAHEDTPALIREALTRWGSAIDPVPPSLKKQAWKLLETYGTSGVKLTADQCSTIRRALEPLPDGQA